MASNKINFSSKSELLVNSLIKKDIDLNKRISNSSDISMYKGLNKNSLYTSGFMARPIGIVGKNYNFIKETLNRNIGNGEFTYDGHGSSISSLANFALNSESTPSFLLDDDRKKFDNYLHYIDTIYYNGKMKPTINDDKLSNHISLLFDVNRVGVVRDFDMDYPTNTNQNGSSDTKIGIIRNEYLSDLLKVSRLYSDTHSSYRFYPKSIDGNDIIGNSITQGAYHQFGFIGDYGILHNEFTLRNGMPTPQDAMTNHMIEYTPINGNYGEYDSLLNSSKLILNSSYKTQQFILKSLYGYDLMSPTEVFYDEKSELNVGDLTNKWYLPKQNNSYLNHINKETKVPFSDVSFEVGVDNHLIRYDIKNQGNGHSTSSRILYTYAEAEGNVIGSPYFQATDENSGIEYYKYETYDNNITKDDIISYTNKCFNEKKFETLIGRFHTDPKDRDMLSSAVSEYGMSHGRNLLKKNHKNFKTNGYSDPYCRVWTFHNQYHRLADTIRPLMDGGKTVDLSKTVIGCKYQINRQRLDKYGVKGNNGLVRYSPISEDGVNSIKKCMFSIENLAWKRESIDKTDQVGPLGGRIMWFPPYGLSFSEAVNVSWNPTQFIGRGENIYTYTNTERSGTLQFKLLIDHPSLLNEWRNDNEKNDSLDDDSLEQKVLRFFAGCEILDPCQKNKKAVKKKIQPTPVVVKQEPIMIENKTYSNIVFYVFYPNNYSGADDNANGVVKPMEYLMYGIGPQKIEVNGKVVDYGTIVNDSNGIGYEVSSSGISSVFAKTNGSAVTYSDECKLDGYKFVSYSSKNKVGKQNKWYYRVDKQFENEVFRNNLSYKDTKSFSLNGSGYTSLVNYHTDAKPLLETNELFSFKDVFMALNQDNSNSDNITYLRNLIKDYDVSSVEVQGFASSHGYDENNNILNKNRAQSVIDWLNKCNPIKFDKSKCKIIKTKIGPKLTHNDASSIEAKVWRCSKVMIKLEKEELVEVKNLNNDNDAIKISNNIQTKSQQVSNEVTNVMDISLKSAYNYLNDESNKKIEQVVENSSLELSDGNINRYGNEHEFFQELKVNAPFLHNKIVDKIKYFDPAYHSITPEGFNARLTFLHQCTRQGSTTSSSSKHGNRTASNLSFGAPPICVLRVGDFYNTKILIDSLNITYDDLTWDLNDEGIGVMPMIADISIGFKFLGGSDLSGPIARLQNAVSFNYYANTNVYDDRADTVEYDENGNISEYNAKI